LLDVFEVNNASNLKDAIVEALNSLGGSGSISEVRRYINSKYPGKWKNVDTAMADLCPESASSLYPKKVSNSFLICYLLGICIIRGDQRQGEAPECDSRKFFEECVYEND
jgi:hypothetical protein